LSTLTKILIFLVTIGSIFLCGIVVTYVATAKNYRDQYNQIRSERDSLKESSDDLKQQLNSKIAEMVASENKLNDEINSLNIQISTLKGDLKKINDDNKNLLQRFTNMESVVETTSQTSNETTKMLMDTQAKLTEAEATKTKLDSQLEETSETLLEKLAIIQTLETEKKRMLEEKTELQSRLDRLLRPTGKVPTPVVAVTPQKEIARPAPVTTKEIGLKGLITAVDSKNKMVSISIGTADGVKEGMKFHVTRGDKFICDILIIDTDAENAVGAMELVQEQPRAGDTVTTNL
jgi:septal ring factor EnvC (AmiA/AmiB activator)